jgi:predicted flap endonuclease-1-like 5' DNA nuclease
VAWFLGQSLLIIIVSILLGLLLGWILWGRVARRTVVMAAAPAAVAAPPAPVVESEPATVEPEPTPEPAAAPEPVAAVEPEPVPVPVPVVEPEPVVAAEPGPRPEEQPDDDLERIEGIGPKMAGALRQAGIRGYSRLAGSDEATLRTAIKDAGLSFAPSLVTWASQARLLADGDEEGFADLVRRLVAGRDVGRA